MNIITETMDYYAINNKLNKTNIYYKLIFTITTIIVNLLAQSYIIPIIIFLFVSFLIIYKAKISIKVYSMFMATPIAFGLISLIFMSLFFGEGVQIFRLGIFGWGVTASGFNLGALLLARILGGVSCIGFLVLTTPANRLFTVAENLKIPKIIIDISLLMYRFIFMFLESATVMYNAQKTRLGYHNYKSSFYCLGILSSMIFIRTWDQGEISYNALKSRGYDGEINLLNDEKSISDISKINILLLILFEILLIIGIILSGTTSIL